MKTQVLVIGAGPGGYVAAIKLGKLGKQVLLVERDALGGECLNYGCIPSKAMISTANVLHKARKAKEIGIAFESLSVDMPKLQAWRMNLIKGFNRGIAALCKSNGIDILMGEASFTGPNSAEIKTSAGIEAVTFEHAIIATGTRPMKLPGFDIDGKKFLTNREALELQEVPRRLLVIGGGVIGLEIGTYYAKFGSKVTIVEMTGQLLPGMEPELVQPIARSLAKLGVDVHVHSKALSPAAKEDCLEVTLSTPEGEKKLEVDKILLSAGRVPAADKLRLEAAGVKTDPKGFIAVNNAFETSAPNIHAIGDIAGPPFLAHKASREGILAALKIAGKAPPLPAVVPWVIFTDPEAAFVGLTEAQAKDQGKETVLGRFPFLASGRAQASREPDGFVRVLAEKSTGKILGAAIVGAGASDLISEACLALRMNATLEDVASTVHPHPTLPEAFLEACEAALGQSIHTLTPTRK